MTKNKNIKLPPPAKTLEGREQQLILLAIDLAAKQLAEGTASAQVQTHFLKLGTVRARLELEKIKKENLLLAAKAEALASTQRIEELYEDAIRAMRSYQGLADEWPEGDDYDN